MQKLRSYALIALLALVAIVAIQNLATVELTFLFWSMRVPRAILVLLCALVGFGAGFGWAQLRPGKRPAGRA